MQIRVTCMLIAIGIGFILDCIFGDPYWMWHIIRLVGRTITFIEKHLRKTTDTPRMARFKGLINVVVVLLLFGGGSLLILYVAYNISIYLGIIIEALLCYQLLAARSLEYESSKVYKALIEGDIEKARYNVSMIVGRDTNALDETGITKACIETVAENTSDGIIAPLFYMFIGGGVLGLIYKCINTMDSMLGYKNDKYYYYGYCPAKLDDIVNYIPSRISAILMIASAYILRYDYKQAIKIFVRDRYNHKSPNSAQTEAVCAGALNVMLAGNAYYFGKLYEKPTIGDDIKKVEPQDIRRAQRLMYCTCILMLILTYVGFAIGIRG